MTDLISRADAIEAKPEYRNEDMWDKEKSTYNKGWNDCNDAWVAIIKALPSAEAEWIPVSERLPSEDSRYLVSYEGTIIGSNIEIMWYGEPLMPNVDVSGKHFYKSDDEWGDIIYDEVIAWMPLPTPYKGGDTE